MGIGVADIEVEGGSHGAGEFVFTPDRLTLSLYLGAPLSLEQHGDRAWWGVSVRGDVKVMVPGQERVFRHRQAAEFATIELPGADVAIAPRLMLRDPPISQLALGLVRSARHPLGRMHREALAGRLLELLGRVDGRAEAPPRRGLSRPALRRVLEYLHEHVAADLSVVELAAIAGLRPSHFTAMFRNSTGQPPHRYHVGLRIERACQLLEQGNDPTRAAHAVGFYDVSHLTRHMRRILGMTPGRIARRASP